MSTCPTEPPGPHDFTVEACPHCDTFQWPSRTDQHVATVHADLPPCTARLDNEYGSYTCILRAGHRIGHGQYGDYHASVIGPNGRTVWNDTADGATPHKEQS